MQSGFCTNCGQPLAAGSAFCASCGRRVEAQPDAPTPGAYSVPPNTPPYAPGSNSPAAFTPGVPPTPPKNNQTPSWVGWAVGCLVAFIVVVAGLIGLLVLGLLTHRLIFFAIGLSGLVVLLLIGVAIEHLIRRLYRRVKYGVEGAVGMGGNRYGAPSRYGGQARPYRQPTFNPIRFVFSLAIIAGLAYGGLYLYYTQQFVGDWSGTLVIGNNTQGIQTNFQISVPLHSPSNPSVNDPPSLAVTQVQFKTATVQACKNGGSYQLSGTASRLDASTVSMTLNTGKETVPLTGAYQNGAFHLTGANAAKQTVSLTLEKGDNQGGYLAACG